MVVCEGAGSPAEINLRATDIANMGLAQAADLPVVVVGDIDRGGVLAHLFGTARRARPGRPGPDRRVRDQQVPRRPGAARTRPRPARARSPAARRSACCPGRTRLWLDAEDSLSAVADGVLGRPAPPRGSQWLRVAVVRLPRISNATDAEALACEPGVAVRYVTEPSRLLDADLVVLPGSKSTVSDLAWLRRTGLADAVVAHARAGRPVLGICGGYQMLGRRIARPARGRGRRRRTGWACSTWRSSSTPTSTSATRPARPGASRCAATRSTTAGSSAPGDPPLLRRAEGSDAGAVLGTHWHGLLENDGFRRALLRRVADAGRPDRVRRRARTPRSPPSATAQLDLLGDLVEEHLDTART